MLIKQETHNLFFTFFPPDKELGKVITRQKQVKILHQWGKPKCVMKELSFYSETHHVLEQPLKR